VQGVTPEPGRGNPFIMFEHLESRRLLSTLSSVTFYSIGGQSGAVINKHMSLVVLVHGGEENAMDLQETAKAVQGQLPSNQYQVLLLDWSELATSSHAVEVGDRLAGMIQNSHIPISRVNLIGFSMGGTVIDQAAHELKTKNSEINCLIGEDPAEGRGASPNYAGDARYSLCFCGDDRYGGTAESLSADDAVLVSNISSDAFTAHVDVFFTVNNMWEQDAGMMSSGDSAVSELFSIPNLLKGAPLNWKRHSVDGRWEGTLRTNGDTNNPVAASFTYVNSRGHSVTVS
jgi:pimeloyl-ACP methyl ester carboxylesterase